MNTYKPLRANDFHINRIPDVFDTIRYNIVYKEESWDGICLGGKGVSKSTTMMALGIKYEHLNADNVDNILKHWGFTTEDRRRMEKELRPGDALIHDEVGTRLSGSSYKWQDKDNQQLADEDQLNRNYRLFHISATLDAKRVIKRVRQTYKLYVWPAKKLNYWDTGVGLATDFFMRVAEARPFDFSENPYNLPYWRYSRGGRIKMFRIYHPPGSIWFKYKGLREEFQERLDEQEDQRRQVAENKARASGPDGQYKRIKELQKQYSTPLPSSI